MSNYLALLAQTERDAKRINDLQAAIKQQLADMGRQADALRADAERDTLTIRELAADAARYRWLRPALTAGGSFEYDSELTRAFSRMTTTPTPGEFDAAIDAAKAKS